MIKFSKAPIYQAEFSQFMIYHNIVWFDISMHYALRMAVIQGLHNSKLQHSYNRKRFLISRLSKSGSWIRSGGDSKIVKHKVVTKIGRSYLLEFRHSLQSAPSRLNCSIWLAFIAASNTYIVLGLKGWI